MNALITTSQIIKKYGLDAKKSLGQNFILDKNFTDKIVKQVGDLSSYEVLEIGPGPGSLTRSILDAGAKKLFVVEKDRRCIEALSELKHFYQDRLEIVEADALKLNEAEIFGNKKFKIIANLPYNIGTVLIFKWLKNYQQISSMHLMLQQEVVERIVAKCGDNHYGRLAVMISLLCKSKMLFKVNPSIFTPPPKVTSAIVEIIPHEKPVFDVDFSRLEMVVAAAFSQRRKMIRSSLRSIFSNIEEVLEQLGIKKELRAENLSLEQFCSIASFYP